MIIEKNTTASSVYLAPLQGLTDWIFREALCKYIGGVDKTFSPFIRIENESYNRVSHCRDILPGNNQFQQPVPQFLGNDVASYRIFAALCRSYGYKEVNINMGCPYPMVTRRMLGAGMLPDPAQVHSFLEEVFMQSDFQVSVKCRLGMFSSDEFSPLFSVFNKVRPLELILHPRTGIQQYKGHVDREAFFHFAEQLTVPLVYNGDIQRVTDVPHQAKKLMVGRGMLTNPFLGLEIKGAEPARNRKIEMLMDFHQYMIELCARKYANEQQYIRRFEELWSYHSALYDDAHRVFKQIKKCKSIHQYEHILKSVIQNQLIE